MWWTGEVNRRRHSCNVAVRVWLLTAAATVSTSCSLAAEAVHFDRDVQPILARRCLKCHGHDHPEAGLRLTDRAAATAELESGQKAIVPGDPTASALLERVTAEDAGLRMPPEGPPLSAKEIERLQQWILAGAEWSPHWAYRPPQRPALPVPASATPIDADWARTPLDYFVLERLRAENMRPSPPADKRVLLRRLYFDLIGLPPTPEEMADFLEDATPQAYERVADRLLASPRYGERWARHWMDVVHWAETHGHDQDRPREHAWPYRDYLIQAWNEDLPYATFVQQQVAGDVLFPNQPRALVATGFLATGPWDESSLRDIRENTLDRQIARYLDRDDIVTTVMSTFTSSTVHCARCHDHKFDPISQREYYGLQAVFAGTDKANRQYDVDPQVALRRQQLQDALRKLTERQSARDASLLEEAKAADLVAWENRLRHLFSSWVPMDLVEHRSGGGAELTPQEDGSLLAAGSRPDKDIYTLAYRGLPEPFTGLQLEVLTDPSLPQQGPGRADNGNLHLSELRAWMVDDSGERELTLRNASADFNQDGWTIAMALDGNPNTAWGIHPEEGRAHRAVFELAEPVPVGPGAKLRIELHQLHGGGHLIGRFRLLATSLPPPLADCGTAPSELVDAIRTPRHERSLQQQFVAAAAFLEQKWADELNALPPQATVYCGTNEFDPDGSFRPAAKPRDVHVLHRGDVTQPGPKATPAALGCLPNLSGTLDIADPDEEGQRRAALARWLADPANMLTWRSIANRLWHYHFGRGLVETPNDFGQMGASPTHPELLEWMALELRDGGGSIKALQRLIVTSATYQQSSADVPTYSARDADNRLLWRMNRRRLDAESIRDAVLQIAGTLDNRMGGPSVKQFDQSPGVHVTPEVDYLNFDVDAPELRRRSVYRFVFRTMPDPFMEALDCPDASQLAPRRTHSLTALQALAMLNDRVLIRQSEHIATRIQRQSDDPAEQLCTAFRLILGRQPEAAEAQWTLEYLSRHGLANTCRFLLNSNEFMFVD